MVKNIRFYLTLMVKYITYTTLLVVKSKCYYLWKGAKPGGRLRFWI